MITTPGATITTLTTFVVTVALNPTLDSEKSFGEAYVAMHAAIPGKYFVAEENEYMDHEKGTISFHFTEE